MKPLLYEVLFNTKNALGPVIKDHGFQLERKCQRSKVKGQRSTINAWADVRISVPFVRFRRMSLTRILSTSIYNFNSIFYIHFLFLQ